MDETGRDLVSSFEGPRLRAATLTPTQPLHVHARGGKSYHHPPRHARELCAPPIPTRSHIGRAPPPTRRPLRAHADADTNTAKPP